MFKRKSFISVDKIRFEFTNNELNKILLKSLLASADFLFVFRLYFFYVLQKYSIYASTSSVRRLCVVSGYSRSIFRLFKMSRHNCKKYASLGVLSGMRKSSF